MKTILAQHDDFKNEKSKLEHFMESKGHTVVFLPRTKPDQKSLGIVKKIHKSIL